PLKVFADNYILIIPPQFNFNVQLIENPIIYQSKDVQNTEVKEDVEEIISVEQYRKHTEKRKSIHDDNASIRTFFPDITSGLIGLSEDVAFDDPSDNFFNFYIDSFIKENEEVFYLEYDIKGIEN